MKITVRVTRVREVEVDVGDSQDPVEAALCASECVNADGSYDGGSGVVNVCDLDAERIVCAVSSETVEVPQADGFSDPFGIRATRDGKQWIIRGFKTEARMRQAALDMVKSILPGDNAPVLELVRFV